MSKYERVKRRVCEILGKAKPNDKPSIAYDIISEVLIITSVLFIIIETFSVPKLAHDVMHTVEVGIATIFAIEYIFRVWLAPLEYPTVSPFRARIKYIFSFLAIVDILAIVPIFFASLSTATGLLKLFKLCKIMRLIKVGKHINGFSDFTVAIRRNAKPIIFSIIFIAVLIAVCSILLFTFEHKAQPQVVINGFSGIIYCLETVFIGQASFVLVTTWGKVLSVIILLLGGCMLGVPIAIITFVFQHTFFDKPPKYKKEKEDKVKNILLEFSKLTKEEQIKVIEMINMEEENV